MQKRAALIKARLALGLTQPQMAERLGITRLAVLNIEVGRRDPSYELMLKWNEVLGPRGGLHLWAGTRVHGIVSDVLKRERTRAPAA